MTGLVTRLQYAAGSERLKGDWRTRKLLEEAARTLRAKEASSKVTPPEETTIAPTQEDMDLAVLCIPAALIFAEYPEHIKDARQRAARHIARARIARGDAA